MVHCRSPWGAWKHAQRSCKRGFLPPPPPPPVFLGVEEVSIGWSVGVELLPTPAPPPIIRTAVPRNRYHWDDFCDDVEVVCPRSGSPGEVIFFVDAPISSKDVSYRKTLCLASCIAMPCAVEAFAPVELDCDVEAFSPSLVGPVLEDSPVLEKNALVYVLCLFLWLWWNHWLLMLCWDRKPLQLSKLN